MSDEVTIVECPRDAWQGLRQVIPTEEKVRYLSRLISLGFRHIDAVSFVSPKHVPQMADSEAVMARLSQVKTPAGEAPEIIGIVVNAQGLERAIATPGVTTVGLSVFDFGVFPAGECEHVPRGIARAGGEAAARHESGREKTGGVHFDGVWESLRRAVGAGAGGRNAGVAEGFRRADRFACGYGGDGVAGGSRGALSRR